MELRNRFTAAKIVGTGISSEVYRRQDPNIKRGDPAFIMSRGELMLFASCPRRWLDGYEPKSSKATEWGTIMDAKLCRPNSFKDEFAIRPATYPATKTSSQVKAGECDIGDPVPWNSAAKFCKDWKKEQGDRTIVTAEDDKDSNQAIAKLYADPIVGPFLNLSECQVMVIGEYHDKATGLIIPVKALLDLVPRTDSPHGMALADYKTCRSASPGMWTKAVFNEGYHVQAAFYTDLYVAATGEDRNTWYHVLQENLFPWAVGRRLLSAEFVELGRATYISALRQYCQCLKEKIWPTWDDAGPSVINGWGICRPLPYMIEFSDQVTIPDPAWVADHDDENAGITP